MNCWSCGEPLDSAACRLCDIECPAPDPDDEYEYDQRMYGRD